MWEAGRGKAFISVFLLSFCTGQANCLLTSGRCLSLHPLRKFCHSGLAAHSRLRDIWSAQASLGWGGSCVCYIMSDPLFEFLPSLSHSYTQTQTDIVWWGHAVASRCVRSSAYLESICLLPLTDPETAGLSVASLSVSFMTGVEKSGKKRRVWEMMRWGRRERGR